MFSVLQIKSDKSLSMKKERIPVLFFFFLHKTELLYVLHKTELLYVLHKTELLYVLHKTESLYVFT